MQNPRLRTVYKQRKWPLLAPVRKIMALGRKTPSTSASTVGCAYMLRFYTCSAPTARFGLLYRNILISNVWPLTYSVSVAWRVRCQLTLYYPPQLTNRQKSNLTKGKRNGKKLPIEIGRLWYLRCRSVCRLWREGWIA